MTEHFGVAGPETEREYTAFLGRNPERRLARDAPGDVVVRCDVLCFRMLYNHPDRDNDVGGTFAREACYFTYYNSLAYDHIHIIDNGDANVRGDALRRADVLQALDDHPEGEPLSAVVFFCHGWAHGCQMGFAIDSLPELVEKLAAKCSSDVRIILYCCGTASSPEEERLMVLRQRIADREAHHPEEATDAQREAEQVDIRRREEVIAAQVAGVGGFAFSLRDLLVVTNPGCQVTAHVTTGHATRNPEVRRFSAPAGAGGVRPIPHGSGPRAHGRGAHRVEADPSHELWQRWTHTLANPFDAARPSALLWQFPFMSDEEIRTHLDDLYGDEDDAAPADGASTDPAPADAAPADPAPVDAAPADAAPTEAAPTDECPPAG